ncbi:ABC transporter substrate-binding protein [Ruania alba]|uniref:ABC-type glycerol-3-phosphate transport system, substrate-binding protein n=1 Tax=Ruania alba TaxID=648782 RepID=A0A1H5GZU6_9MICO|nr:extracellular solute-binding protein [Ruania alba]SEE21227.1 ABC-type glycerol-3-phosphate transport system, substrate-binding protein [Ruania alba]
MRGNGDGGSSDADGETLTVWSYFTSPGQIAALEEQNALFEAAHPDVTLESVTLPGDQVVQRLLSTATTQEGPDVVFDNVVVDFPTLAGSGVLYDMSSYWSEYEHADQFPDNATWEYEGGIYNVMSYTNLLGLYYNADALAEIGIEPPTTIEEFDAALHTVLEDGRYTPLALSGAPDVGSAWVTFPQLLGEGVNYCNISEEATESAFSRLQSWAESGIIPQDAATWDQTDAWQPFMTGNYAFAINGNWQLGNVPDASFEVGTTRYPAGSEGSHVFPGGEGIAIGEYASNPDLAWEYIKTAFMSDEGSEINYENSGQIPMRADVAENLDLSENELVIPFVEAAAETGVWPANEQTGEMQLQFGQATSAVISGQAPASEAAAMAVTGIEEAREAGGGGC